MFGDLSDGLMDPDENDNAGFSRGGTKYRATSEVVQICTCHRQNRQIRQIKLGTLYLLDPIKTTVGPPADSGFSAWTTNWQ